MEEIAMRAMELDEVEARSDGPQCREAPAFGELGHLGTGELGRREPVVAQRNRARSDNAPRLVSALGIGRAERPIAEPGPLHAGLASCMAELDSRNRALAFEETS